MARHWDNIGSLVCDELPAHFIEDCGWDCYKSPLDDLDESDGIDATTGELEDAQSYFDRILARA